MSVAKGYSKVVKGKLSFKGNSGKIGKSSTKRKREYGLSSAHVSGSDGKVANDSGRQHNDSVEDQEPVERQGTGRITTSGTTVTGHYTEFMSQLKPGDAIIIVHPTTLQRETKIVRMVLSNISIGVSSAFSSDLISTTPFTYVEAPKDESQEEEQRRKEIRKKHATEEAAFGTYASEGGEKFVYRVKKGTAEGGGGGYGGYKIVTETLSGSRSREDLLNMRSKKKSDRHC